METARPDQRPAVDQAVELGPPRVLVVCESMFGNTRAVASAVADTLAMHGNAVDVVDAAEAPLSIVGVDLLVVGAPTHRFGMSRPATRRRARGRTGAPSGERGAREWLAELEPVTTPVHAAVFDTRIRKPLIPGSAARAIRRRLRRLGFDVLSPISFSVAHTGGPLVPGELDVAREWADELAAPWGSATSRRPSAPNVPHG